MSIPLIHVTHLPSSHSFYAQVVQPLGISYLNTSSSASGSKCMHFGIPPSETIFTLQESPRLSPTTMTLRASNSTQVTQFHTRALEANTTGRNTNLISKDENAAFARTVDLDGNLLEVVYERHPGSGSQKQRRGSGSGSVRSNRRLQREEIGSSHTHTEVVNQGTTITTSSTAKEAQRVLSWQREVARSVSSADEDEDRERALAIRQPSVKTEVPSRHTSSSYAVPSQVPTAPSMSAFSQTTVRQTPPPAQQPQIADLGVLPGLLRAATAPVGQMLSQFTEATEKLSEGSGMSNQALIGTLIGAAAGAAVAYAMVRSEEPEKERPELVTHYPPPAHALTSGPTMMSTGSGSSQVPPIPMQMVYKTAPQQGHHLNEYIAGSPQAPQMERRGSKTGSVSGSKVSRSESRKDTLKYEETGSRAGSRAGSLREERAFLEGVEEGRRMDYSSSPKSVASHHTSKSRREKDDGERSHVSRSSKHTSKDVDRDRSDRGGKSSKSVKPESHISKSESKHSSSRSSASRKGREKDGSEASTVTPAKSVSKSGVSGVLSEAKSERSHHSGGTATGFSVHSVKSEKSKHSHRSGDTTTSERARRAPLPESVYEASLAGTVAPSDSVSQIGSRYCNPDNRRRGEVY